MPDRLASDLRRYFGVRLSDVWVGKEDMLEVAHYAAHIPRGGAVTEWFGGWGAVTAEDEALRRVEYVITAVNSAKDKQPKVPKPPESIRDQEAKLARTRERLARAERLAKSLG